LKRLHARIAEFERTGSLLRDAVARDLQSGSAPPGKIQRLNEQLLQVESNWLDPAGIPGRPWFQHLLYSSRYTYAHLEFPGSPKPRKSRTGNWLASKRRCWKSRGEKHKIAKIGTIFLEKNKR